MILSLLSLPLPPSTLCTIFGKHGLPCPMTSPCVSFSPSLVSFGLSMFVLSWGGEGWQGNMLLWGGGGEGGSSCPVPSFPLRRKIPAQGGPLLVSVYLVLVVLATYFR